MHLRYTIAAVIMALGMFVSMLVFLEWGRRIGLRTVNKREAQTGIGVVDGVVYGLLALLIGFSFNGAAERFDVRRTLTAEATNSAGTAWQRLDLLPAASQPEVRAQFRDYIDTLIESFTGKTDVGNQLTEPAAQAAAANRLWASAVAVCITPEGEKARMLVLPSLNELFGAVERERVARRIHPPRIIYLLLCISAMAGAMFSGYALAAATSRTWIYMIGIALIISSAIYVVVELEFPRVGVVRIDNIDQLLVDLRATMR